MIGLVPFAQFVNRNDLKQEGAIRQKGAKKLQVVFACQPCLASLCVVNLRIAPMEGMRRSVSAS